MIEVNGNLRHQQMPRSSLRKDVRVSKIYVFSIFDLLVTRFMTEQDAIAAMEALEAQNAAKAREVQIAAAMAADKTVVSDTDTTFAGNITSMASSKPNSAPKKKGTKTKLTAKEKKERSVSFLRIVTCVRLDAATHCLCNQIEAERIIVCLPLEFRGSDPVC